MFSPVGMPRLGVVRIDNRLKTETVKLISISGNTANFHSSFFADQVILFLNTLICEVKMLLITNYECIHLCFSSLVLAISHLLNWCF